MYRPVIAVLYQLGKYIFRERERERERERDTERERERERERDLERFLYLLGLLKYTCSILLFEFRKYKSC